MNTTAEEKIRVLIVDDDSIVADSLVAMLAMEGYDAQSCGDYNAACLLLDSGRFEIVVSDINMPGGGGLELLRHVRKNFPDIVMILITGYGTIESAVDSMRQGAFDYLTKPVIDEDVLWCLQRAVRQQRLLAENRRLRQKLTDRYSFENIIASDHRMLRVFEIIQAVADSRSTVLITGESGTGKSMIARALHSHSPRRDKPFVEMACGSLPENLLESELFGHVSGAFTGASADREGKFTVADGGTLFLDEIDTATPAMQVKLLRVLQEQCFEPVGSNVTQKVDVRVVLATNSDLKSKVDSGAFRQDLYYRINVVNIELPPLRLRSGDIALLAAHFVEKYSDENSRQVKGLDENALRILQSYNWPGNIRELENCMERAVLLSNSDRISSVDLPPELASHAADSNVASPVSNGMTDQPQTLADALAGPERQIILASLRRHNGNRQEAARQLGINRTTLYKKMKKYSIEYDGA